MQKKEDKEVELIFLTHEEIDSKIMKYVEKYKGHEVNRVFFIREIITGLRKEGILVSEDYIRKFLRKLERQGLIEEDEHFMKIF